MAAYLYSGVNYLTLSIDTPYDNINDSSTLRDDLMAVKVWYSTVQGFNPDSQGTLAFSGFSLNITINGLNPNTRYYVRYALQSAIDPDTYTYSNELTELTDPQPSDGKAVTIAPTYNAFVYNAAGALPSPSTSTITATTYNFTSTPYYEWYIDGVLVAGNNTNTLSYTPRSAYSDMPDSVSVKVRDGGSGQPVVAEDSLVMFGVIPGTNAITVVNYNPAHSLYTTSAGAVTYSGSGTSIQVLEGSIYLTIDNSATPANGTFKVSAVGESGYITPSTSITTAFNNTTVVYGDHSAMTQNSARIIYTVTVKDSAGVVKTFISYQNFTKSIQGAKGDKGDRGDDGTSIQGDPGLKTANGLLYYQLTSSTAPSKVGLTGTYNFSDNAVTLSDSTNWSVNAPVFQASNGNNYWYVRFTVTESYSGSNSGTLVLGTVSQTIGFSGLVTFSNNTITNGSTTFNYTAIDGSAITTGSITSTNYQAPVSPSVFAGAGTRFNLADGSIISKTFVIDTNGNASFSGSVTSGEIFTSTTGNRIELNKKTSGTGDNRLKVYNQTGGQIVSIGGNGTEAAPPISINLLNADTSSNNYATGLEILVPGVTNTNIVTNKFIGATPFTIKTKTGESDTKYGNYSVAIGDWSSQPPNPPSLSGSYRYPPLAISGFNAWHSWPSASGSNPNYMSATFNSFTDTFNNPGNNPRWRTARFYSYKYGSPTAETNEVIIGDWTNNYAINIVSGVLRYGSVTIATPPNNTTQYLRADGTWQTVSSGYILPLAASGTRGGVQIGFATNSGARNYAVQLSGEQMYVNVPWTDTDTDTWIANSSSQAGYVASGSGQANKVWKTDGSGNPAWRDDSDTVYSLPLAANGTRGGVQIGYTQSGQNYPVQLSGEKMYVNVPWTDTNSGGTVTSVATGNGLTGGTITGSGTIQMSGSYTGSFSATGEITAYSSDARLKTNIRTIDNAIDKVLQLSGIIYNFNDLAETYGYDKHTEHVGLLAQQVASVLPQAVAPAPFDIEKVHGKEVSKSGENYLTIKYEKLVALLVEAIKEQQSQIEELKQLIRGGIN